MTGTNTYGADSHTDSCEAEYDRLRRAVRGSSDGLWEWDLTTNTVWYAPQFLELLGYNSEYFSDKIECWADRIHPDDYPETWDGMQRHLFEGNEYDLKYRLLTKNGSYSWFRTRGKAYLDDLGLPVWMSGSIRNIDDIYQAELELREKDRQLQQQQKIDAIGSLASGIAHEFNNLLQTISGYTQFACESVPADSQTHQDLQKVLRSAKHATALTRQLLDFSRPDEVAPHPSPVDQIVQDLADMLEPLLPGNIDFQLHLGSHDTSVLVDVQRAQQALLNLCINARDAMPMGGELCIHTHLVSHDEPELAPHLNLDAGNYVCLTVTDTGTGIPEDVQQHIFEPFYTTKEVAKGTGLGLSVTYGVIQQSGGKVDFQSERDHGTSFQVYLPVYAKGSDMVDDNEQYQKELIS